MNSQEKFNKVYDRERGIIDEKLSGLLVQRQPASLYSPASYILDLSGKRLRPFLVLLAVKAGGGKYKDAYNAALAVEMLHSFTLVHDDIMDNADIRRGQMTLHKKYDLSTAILSGDVLLAVAYEYLLKDAKTNANAVIAEFTRGLIEVCEGQGLDKEFEARKKVGLDEYLVMITKKTAVLVETCCAIGALIAGADKKTVAGLRNFGLNVGIAFQIQDDLLDIIANEKEFGKKIGGDLIEGKKTFLLLTALKNARGKNLASIKRVINERGIPESEVILYKRIFEDTGAIEEAKRTIRIYTDKALKSLRVLPDSADKEIFHWLSDLLIKRTY